MNLGELINAFRDRLDDKPDSTDPNAKSLWSDDEITLYANEADAEAADRGRYIVDSATLSVCRIPLVANTGTYRIHKSILEVKSIKLASTGIALEKVSSAYMDGLLPTWETETGDVLRWVDDRDEGKIMVSNVPTVADTLNLSVVRLPINAMVSHNDEPEAPLRRHYDLLYWMEYLAYQKKDTDTEDAAKAARASALFDRAFGPSLASARDQHYLRRARPRVVSTAFV